MPDKKRRNLFEEHIESEDFDVSELGAFSSLTLSPQLVELLASLPQPLDYRIWDEYLDERQKLLCAQLTIEIIDRVLREQFSQNVMHFSDDELVYMLTVPVALSILVESRLGEQADPPQREDTLEDAIKDLSQKSKETQPTVENPEWANALGQFVRDMGSFLRKLIKRK
jgi:hypothetical protein